MRSLTILFTLLLLASFQGILHRAWKFPIQSRTSQIHRKVSFRLRETNSNANVDEFFLIDKENGNKILLSKEEKERIFLDAIQSYYYNGKSTLANTDFDKLREDLEWDGSVLVTLNRNEALFLNAMQSYNKGTPILSDKEFDDLKTALKEAGSKIAVSSEPKQYMDTGVSKVTWAVDSLRTNSLYVPATLFSSIIYLGVFYELPFIRDFFNPLLFLAIGSYPIFRAAKKITEEFLFKEPLVAIGKCPNCGVENKVFFGDVFGVKGDDDESTVKCTNCKASLTIKRNTLRVSSAISKPKRGPPASEESE